MLSSIAELTYPAIAVVAGIYAYNAHLRWTQWIGIAVIMGTVTLLPFQRRRRVVSVSTTDAALATT
jgi:drug/metabolite transporter (DMT)-like permease